MTATAKEMHDRVRAAGMELMATSDGLQWLEERLAASKGRAKRSEKLGFAVALPLSLLMMVAIVAVFPDAAESNPNIVLLGLAPGVFQAFDVILRLLEVRRINAFVEMAKTLDSLASARG